MHGVVSHFCADEWLLNAESYALLGECVLQQIQKGEGCWYIPRLSVADATVLWDDGTEGIQVGACAVA